MKKAILIVSMLISLLCAAQADTTQFGGEMFVQRHSTIAAIDIPVRTLWQKNAVSIKTSLLGGYNVTSTASAFGGAVTAHYSFNKFVDVILGVGCVYDTSKKFQVGDVTSNSVGLVVGLVGHF